MRLRISRPSVEKEKEGTRRETGERGRMKEKSREEDGSVKEEVDKIRVVSR